MGCLTAKASGEIASFINPTVTPIESARVYFSPTQLGEGTPSPENVREIVGRTSVELNHSGRNLAHIVGYSAINSDSNNTRKISNSYGTTINTTEFSLPDTKLVISQSQYPNTNNRVVYQNGYVAVLVDNLIWEQKYNISFKIDNIVSNPLNVSLNEIRLLVPNGNSYISTEVKDNRLFFKNVVWKPYPNTNVNRRNFEIRNCGMSFTLSEFMVTPADDDNYDFKPYQGKTIPFSWKRLPDEYQEVEYIESDGGQYIYTNIQGKSGIECSAKVMWLSGSDTSIFGARKSASDRIMLIHQYPSKKWTLGYGSSYTGISNITYNTPYNVEAKTAVGEQYLKVDGVTVYEASDLNEYSNDFNMAIFACSYSSNDFRLFANARVYNLCVKNNDTLLGNFIPCYRKSDNEIGMYDTVSQTFYTNQGTGTFLKGDDVFSDEVYGGYVDLVKGEIVEEYLKYTIDNNNSNILYNGIINGIANFRISKNNLDIIPIGNMYVYFNNLEKTVDKEFAGWINANTKAILFYMPNTYNSLDKFKEFLVEHPIDVVYKINPIIHPLPDYLKTQLQTFKNENNIWSDGDSVEVDYDLAETFDIQKAKRKIIMSQPHVESASNTPSSPQVIKFKTDMKAPLKQCIVNFTPIQEGSGDPSPTNIRPIKGWNGITLKHTGINMLQCSSPSYYIDATNNGITSQSSRNADNEIIGIDFNGTTTSTNIFRNLNYNPSDSGAVTMPRGLMGLTGYSDQVYVVPMGNGNAPRTTDGRYWTGANTNSENGWNVWSVDSSETYNGLWVRTQVFPRETNVNVDTTVYPMMCLAEDVGCEFEPYKGETFNVDWTDDAGTVYGGYINLVSGELWADHAMFTVDEPNATCTLTSPSMLRFVFPLKYYFSGVSRKGASMCTILPENASTNWDYGYVDNISATATTGNHQLCLNYVGNGDGWSELVGEEATVENVKAYLRNAGFAICATLRTPILITTLTPQQLITLKGQNNLWADTNGTIDVKYWNHKKSYSTGVIYEAENLAFDGTNYIDTGVYLFSEENINRDFEVVIEDLYGNSGAGSITIVCAKYDSTAVGFLIRLNSSTSTTYNGTIFMKPNNHNNITIKRVNGVITIDGEVITNPTVKFTNTVHNHPLVLGCALEDDGTPMRYATGTIGHITVKWL